MKKLIIFFIFSCISITTKAQLYEAGIFVGGSNYIGDIGSEYYMKPNSLMGGVIYKWNMNPRVAIRGTFTYAQINADDKDATNRERYYRGIGFSNTIKELAIGLEFNYFEYNLSDFRKTHTPYILLELAAFNYSIVTKETGVEQYEYGSNTSFAIPFGLGYKTKLGAGFAIAAEVRARYTFVDDIDYNNNNINSLKFGNPNSNDWYVLSGISLVYTFGRPPCYVTPY
ncbi:DUF6089 family protein [Lutibacter sp.]|uniref:type IX secretion system protein PorG n=1 Tax=Lutibacter sp. TaxID=1925666 RepID=UPI001A1A06CC|nr:DUF6089 family protein [Lutibacter sp.]MBI9039974.1 hypothetical protein [Lutibacter sp.]